MDSSAPSILPPWVRVPSAFSIYIVQIVYFSFELECESNENKQKEAGIGPFLKNSYHFPLPAHGSSSHLIGVTLLKL